jgi:feruloyl esterase
MQTIVRGLLAISVVTVLATGQAIAAESAQASALTASSQPAQRCAALGEQRGPALGERTARILTTKFNGPVAATTDPSAPFYAQAVPGMPEHCEVIGVMRERVARDGQHYAVKFHVRMPTAWNGRFLFQGGGGTNGMLGNATGGVQLGGPTALDGGYAIVSTDTGHDNAINNDPARQGTVVFGYDYQARLEYAEKALDSVATTAKRIVRAYYGHRANRNYFFGCSNGGREGMVFAQRFPRQFDGIVAGAPAFALPRAATAEAWDTQTFAALAKSEGLLNKNGLPDIGRTFSDADFRIVAETVAKVCDADDGIADGMVSNLFRCTTARIKPALESQACAGQKEAGCLTHEQVAALVRSYEGPRNSQGQALYADWPWDIGIADRGWRMWKIGGMGGPMGGTEAINVMLGAAALSALFVTPPVPVAATGEALLRYHLEFNFDRDFASTYATTRDFPRSGWDLMSAQSPNLAGFRRHGGKMLVPHGGSDPIFSINDTISWWRKVDAANRGGAAEFVRVFPVPGMTHCAGGPATDQYNALAALVAWVEEGKAPDRIEAKAGRASPWPGRTRPLCPYPKVARYKSGDVERSESFACELP